MWFEAFWLRDGSCCPSFRQGPPAILRERFARQYERFLRGIGWRGRTGSVGAAIVEVTPGAAIITTALRIPAASAVATAVGAAILALRRRVLGWRKIACAALAVSAATASAASAATTASKSTPSTASTKLWPVATVTADAIATSVATSLATSVGTPVTCTARTVARRWTVLGGIVARRKILRSGFIGIGLTFFLKMFKMRFFDPWCARF
jgi:hypothetical protein